MLWCFFIFILAWRVFSVDTIPGLLASDTGIRSLVFLSFVITSTLRACSFFHHFLAYCNIIPDTPQEEAQDRRTYGTIDWDRFYYYHHTIFYTLFCY